MADVITEPRVRQGHSERDGRNELPRLGLPSRLGLGVGVLWLSLLVVLPLAAVLVKSGGGGWSAFAAAITDSEALSAIVLTVSAALGVALVNAVMGTIIAWVLVRDAFPGKRVLDTLIDIPFALPTIVAGLVLLSLYGPHSPVGVTAYATRPGIVIALLFVTLPFVVRTVEPVLLSLERDVEEAASSLGAGRLTVFRRIILPSVGPAIASGAALAFGRAIGEYGSVVLISGQIAGKTEVSSLYIYKQIQDDNLVGAAATACVLLLISLAVIAAINLIQRRVARRG